MLLYKRIPAPWRAEGETEIVTPRQLRHSYAPAPDCNRVSSDAWRSGRRYDTMVRVLHAIMLGIYMQPSLPGLLLLPPPLTHVGLSSSNHGWR